MNRLDRLLKFVIMASFISLLTLGCLIQLTSVKVFVGRTEEAAKKSIDDWTTFREGRVLWLSTHGCPDGRHLWFRHCLQGDGVYVRLKEVVWFLRTEGVDLDGVDEIVIHSCYNGRWAVFTEDGIRIRPSQHEHAGTVSTDNLGFVFILFKE